MSDTANRKPEPRTIRIGAYSVPEPMREAPKLYSPYFVPDLMGHAYRATFSWEGNERDLAALRNGQCHATAYNAEIHGLALASFTDNSPSPLDGREDPASADHAQGTPHQTRCETCLFWRRIFNSKTSGACHRYPPLAGGDAGTYRIPVTGRTDFCGEHKAAE